MAEKPSFPFRIMISILVRQEVLCATIIPPLLKGDLTKCLLLLLLLLLLLSCFSRVRLYATLETAAHQAPPSLGFSRQEHWSGLPFPSPMHESEK